MDDRIFMLQLNLSLNLKEMLTFPIPGLNYPDEAKNGHDHMQKHLHRASDKAIEKMKKNETWKSAGWPSDDGGKIKWYENEKAKVEIRPQERDEEKRLFETRLEARNWLIAWSRLEKGDMKLEILRNSNKIS